KTRCICTYGRGCGTTWHTQCTFTKWSGGAVLCYAPRAADWMTTGGRHAPIGGGVAAVATLGWVERPQPGLFAKLSGSSRWATGDQRGPCATTGDQPTRVSAVDVPDCLVGVSSLLYLERLAIQRSRGCELGTPRLISAGEHVIARGISNARSKR